MKRRCLIKVIAVTIGLLVCSGVFADELSYQYRGQSYKNLTTPPRDSVDAENVRVWLPLERPNRCRVIVNIVDFRGRLVRRLFEDVVDGGYYNFYWDKRDDSGRFVPEGDYFYDMKDCRRQDRWPLTVKYRPFEQYCLFYPPDDGESPHIRWEVTQDSIPISLEILRSNEKLFFAEFTDSLMMRGAYEYLWVPDSTLKPGIFFLRLTVGEVEYLVKTKVTR